jgi:hypothetical protein
MYALSNDVPHFEFRATTAEFEASKVKVVRLGQLSPTFFFPFFFQSYFFLLSLLYFKFYFK